MKKDVMGACAGSDEDDEAIFAKKAENEREKGKIAMKKIRLLVLSVLVVLLMSSTVDAMAEKAFSFTLRAISSGLDGYRAAKENSQAPFRVTQTSAVPESAYSNAQWTATSYRAVRFSTGAVVSNAVNLSPSSTSGSAGYRETVNVGELLRLRIRLYTSPSYENVYFTIKGRWAP